MAVLGLTGCSFDVRECATDDDCPTGSTCGQPAGTGYAVCIAPELPDAGPDLSDPDPDFGTEEPDESVEPRSDLPDPAAECMAPTFCRGDGDFQDAVELTRFPAGCPTFDLEPMTATREGSVCANEADFYTISYVRCESQSFRIEIVIDVGPQCLENVALELWDDDFRCGQQQTRCERSGDGTQRITMIIPPSDFATPIEEVEFAVAGELDGGANYKLSVSVGR